MTTFIFYQKYHPLKQFRVNLPTPNQVMGSEYTLIETQITQFAVILLAITLLLGYLIYQHTCHASSQCVTLAGFFIPKNSFNTLGVLQ